MKEESEGYKIIVEDVYKTFNVYLDKANTIKEKLLFIFSRNRKEKRKCWNTGSSYQSGHWRKRKYTFECYKTVGRTQRDEWRNFRF